MVQTALLAAGLAAPAAQPARAADAAGGLAAEAAAQGGGVRSPGGAGGVHGEAAIALAVQGCGERRRGLRRT